MQKITSYKWWQPYSINICLTAKTIRNIDDNIHLKAENVSMWCVSVCKYVTGELALCPLPALLRYLWNINKVNSALYGLCVGVHHHSTGLQLHIITFYLDEHHDCLYYIYVDCLWLLCRCCWAVRCRFVSPAWLFVLQMVFAAVSLLLRRCSAASCCSAWVVFCLEISCYAVCLRVVPLSSFRERDHFMGFKTSRQRTAAEY